MKPLNRSFFSKPVIFLILLTGMASCNKSNSITIAVEPTEIAGSLRIECAEAVILSENLQKTRAVYDVTVPKPDFYELKVFPNGADPLPGTYVYLDGQDLRIIPRSVGYTTASSTSPVQNDVSRYYQLLSEGQKELAAAYNTAKVNLSARINQAQATGEELHVLATNLSEAQEQYATVETDITRHFIGSNPGSLFSAFLLDRINDDELSRDPVYYRTLFNQLNKEVKDSFYGKKFNVRVQENLKAIPGTQLPLISGQNADGRPFDPLQIRGKFTLVAFWRSLNKESAQEMISLKDLYKKHHASGFEILAISFDKTPERWKTFIQTNDLPWINICDFEGASSPNLEKFNNDRVPFYFLVGPDFKIRARDVQISELPIYLKEYFSGRTGPASGI